MSERRESILRHLAKHLPSATRTRAALRKDKSCWNDIHIAVLYDGIAKDWAEMILHKGGSPAACARFRSHEASSELSDDTKERLAQAITKNPRFAFLLFGHCKRPTPKENLILIRAIADEPNLAYILRSSKIYLSPEECLLLTQGIVKNQKLADDLEKELLQPLAERDQPTQARVIRLARKPIVSPAP